MHCCHIRWMINRDVPRLLDLARKDPVGWSEKEIRDMTRSASNIGMVAELDEELVGYMVYELHPDRLKVNCFHADGPNADQVAGALISCLIGKLGSHGRSAIEFLVHEAATALQMRLKGLGFLATNVLRKYFDDADSYRMVFIKPPAVCAAEPVARNRSAG